jgi:microcin C transport system permease protein
VQFVPGGPIEQIISQLDNQGDANSRLGGGGNELQNQDAGGATSKYRGAQGLDPEFIKSLEKQFGFDKPAYERFFLMLSNYARFDFGKSYFRDTTVLQLIKEKLPVSISLGI